MTSGVRSHVGMTRTQALRAARPAEWALRFTALALFASACATIPRDSTALVLQFLSLAVVYPVMYITMTPLAIATLGTTSWETRGSKPMPAAAKAG